MRSVSSKLSNFNQSVWYLSSIIAHRLDLFTLSFFISNAYYSGTIGHGKAGASIHLKPLKQIMQNWVRQGYSEAAQLSVYIKNKERVNLFARDDRKNPKFNQNSIISIFSSSKNFEAFLMALAVQRGWIESYDDPVVKYWPEFPTTRLVVPFESYVAFHDESCVDESDMNQCTKSKFRKWCNARNVGSFRKNYTPKIKDILRHEVGYAVNLKQEPIRLNMTTPSDLKRIIENEEYLIHFQESDRSYHGMTRGYVLDQIFMKIEPRGRTMSDYFNEEIAPKLSSNSDTKSDQKSENDFFLRFDGLQNDETAIDRMYHINQAPWYWFLYHVFLPIKMGRNKPFTDLFAKQLCPSDVMDESRCSKESMEDIAYFIKNGGKFRGANITEWNLNAGPKGLSQNFMGKLGSAIMSASGIGSAHSIAKAAAYILFSGEVLKKGTVKSMVSEPVDKLDMMLGWTTSFSRGGVHQFRIQGMKWYGWGGWGGSLFVFNLEHEAVIVFLPTAFNSPHYSNYQIPRVMTILNLVTQQLYSEIKVNGWH